MLGICVGMQVMFEAGDEHGVPHPRAAASWPGTVTRLAAPVLPHMGWNTVRPPEGSALFAGLDPADPVLLRAFLRGHLVPVEGQRPAAAPRLTWAEHGEPFIAAAEHGPLSATQFHPEKSGDAGAAVLANWLETL